PTMADQTTTTGTEVGRALIDRFGDIWRITPEGVRAPEADDHWTREQVERQYGPLREVVLVDPEPEGGLHSGPEIESEPAAASHPQAREETTMPNPTTTTAESDPELLELLADAGRRWGPLGVAIAAADLTDRDALLAKLVGGAT